MTGMHGVHDTRAPRPPVQSGDNDDDDNDNDDDDIAIMMQRDDVKRKPHGDGADRYSWGAVQCAVCTAATCAAQRSAMDTPPPTHTRS